MGLSRFDLDLFTKVGKMTRPVLVIRLHAQVISTVVESVFPVSLPPPARAGPGLAALGPAGPDRTSPRGRAAPGRAGARRAVTGALPGFGTRPAARLRRTRPAGFRHATGGRASERDQASAHTTGPGFGTPLAQLIPRRRIGLCRRFPRFLQLSPC